MAAVTKPKVERTRPTELVEWALTGRIRIPRLEQPFRWDNDDILGLFDSVLRGYPIGALSMWRWPAPAGSQEIGPLLVNAPERPDALWVLDGQQRVTSLVGALAAPEDTVDPRFRVFFDLRTGHFESAGRREHVPEHWLPMTATLRNEDMFRWLRDRPGLTDEEIRRCEGAAAAIRDYEIPMYLIEGDFEQAAEVFRRVNRSGRPRRHAEVLKALSVVADQREPSGLLTLAALAQSFGFGELPDEILMRSIRAVGREETGPGFELEFDPGNDRDGRFPRTRQALGHTVDFLRYGAGIPHVLLLPHSTVIPVLARFAARFGPPRGRAADLLTRWIWRGGVVGVHPHGNVDAVYEDPVASADRLLALLPAGGESWSPDLDRTRLSDAQARLNILALLDQRPAILGPAESGRVGSPVDVVGLLQRREGPLAPILPWPSLGTLANHLVHPALNGHAPLLGEVLGSPPELWESQCLDQVCVEELKRDSWTGFLARRKQILTTVIARNVQRHALFGFRDGPDLRSLFGDEAGPDAA